MSLYSGIKFQLCIKNWSFIIRLVFILSAKFPTLIMCFIRVECGDSFRTFSSILVTSFSILACAKFILKGTFLVLVNRYLQLPHEAFLLPDKNSHQYPHKF